MDPLIARERALALLAAEHVLTLATLDAMGPWAAPVFYASTGLDLHFVSSPRSRHAIAFAQQPRVAGSIHARTAEWREIRGLQLEGDVTVVADAELEGVRAAYEARFPFVNDPTQPTLQAALARVTWFRLRITRLAYLDNTLGFGKRTEILGL